MKVTKRLVKSILAVLLIGVILAGLLGVPAITIAMLFFWVAAFFAIVFPVLYFFGSPWRQTVVGKMMMTKSTSIATVFILSILFRVVPHFPGRDWLIVFAYVFLAVALCFQNFVLIGQQEWFRGRFYDRGDVGRHEHTPQA